MPAVFPDTFEVRVFSTAAGLTGSSFPGAGLSVNDETMGG
jgi:hypothetical protein